MPNLIEIHDKGSGRGAFTVNMHAGQARAWRCNKRFVLVLAGSQGGKTEWGPIWLNREITEKGPGHYGVVSPSFTLMGKKVIPAFRLVFEKCLQLGKYTANPIPIFRFSKSGMKRLWGDVPIIEEPAVYFSHAEDPESLESMTLKAVWLDEAGQARFRLQSWEAIRRRLTIHEGRALLTTTPYNFGWLYEKLYKPWEKAKGDHPEIGVVRFRSVDNPTFSQAEWERLEKELPKWKFDLFHRAIFTRPSGLIYEDFDENDVIPPFEIPHNWARYLGLDFGGANTAAIYYAENPETKTLYAYREYRGGHRTAAEHVEMLKAGEPAGFPTICCGGSKPEQQWRDEFRAAGLFVSPPDITDVELGITRCAGLYKTRRVKVFENLDGYLDELRSYSRETDASGNVGTAIEAKESFHLMDASRYILGRFASVKPAPFLVVAQRDPSVPVSQPKNSSWARLGALSLPKMVRR